jgi:hypothetical protein
VSATTFRGRLSLAGAVETPPSTAPATAEAIIHDLAPIPNRPLADGPIAQDNSRAGEELRRAMCGNTAVEATASYAIDGDGVIVWTDEGFADLARSHGRPELAEHVTGRPLAGFVAGDRTRELQASLIERARTAAEPLELRYRCDGPETRRYAVLAIAARADGSVLFTTWYEAVEERPHQPLLDSRLRRGDDVVRLCAWCNRLDLDGWREAEEAAQHVALSDLPRVEHSVCEICELLLTTRPAGGRRSSFPHGPA